MEKYWAVRTGFTGKVSNSGAGMDTEEDFPLAENIQRDFHSGAQDFVTFGANEPALAYFHRSIKKTLGIDTA